MLAYLLDTSICVGLMRGRTVNTQMPALHECALSSITTAELWTGAEKSAQPELRRLDVEKFLALFTLVSFDQTAARHYGEIRAALEKKGTPIGPLDQLIAAHARSLDAALITANAREFQRVPGLKCVAWKI